MYQYSYIKNLNEEIHKADGAIQHPDHINERYLTIKSTTQGVADHNFFIKTISSTQTLQHCQTVFYIT